MNTPEPNITREHLRHSKYPLIIAAAGIAISVFRFLRGLGRSVQQNEIIEIIDLLATLLSLGLFVSVVLLRRAEREFRILGMLFFLEAIYLVSDAAYYIVWDQEQHHWLNRLTNTVYLACPILMGVLYWRMLDYWTGRSLSRLTRAIQIVLAIYLALIAGNLFGGYLFRVGEDSGRYERGPLYVLTVIVPTAIVIAVAIRVIIMKEERKAKILLLLYPLLPLIGTLLSVTGILPPVAPVIVLGSLLILYNNLFMRREIKYAELRRDLAESRLLMIQMQVNPHFLFNTLASIGSLCDSDPGTAKEMIYRLSNYMRGNITDMRRPSLIPFDEELAHVRNYLSIETMRFPDIHIDYQIGATGFLIPNMTLQPLIENAIKHGIRKRRRGEGEITILTRETKDGAVIKVRDNGVGFDTSSTPTDDMIGIRNVRERLRMFCGGTIEIESTPGSGTECIVKLPKKSGGVAR